MTLVFLGNSLETWAAAVGVAFLSTALMYFVRGLVMNRMEAQFLGRPERIQHRLLPISETHFLMPSDDPLEDTQTVAIYDFKNGVAQYLHTNARGIPRVSN